MAETEPGALLTFAWLVFLLTPQCAVMLHELAHAFVALFLGSGVQDFHVGPAGGYIQHQFPMHSEDRFAIAAAGPLANLAIAFACLQVPAMWPATIFHAYMLACAFYTDGDFHLMRDAVLNPNRVWA